MQNHINPNAFFARFLISFSAIGFRARGLKVSETYDGLAGKSVLVTGATGGLGKAIASACARSGADVFAVGLLKEERRNVAAIKVGRGTLREAHYDLSNTNETLRLLDHIARQDRPIDAVVNNVGILRGRYKAADSGRDMTYTTNLLNPFILTERLIAQSLFAEDGAVINMASGGLYTAPQNLDYLEQAPDEFDGVVGYASQKRALIALSDAWAERGFCAYTMHPGWVATEGVRRAMPGFSGVMKPILRSPDAGADTALWLLGARPEPVPGALWFDRNPRAAHMYAQTRADQTSALEILAKLGSDAAHDLGVWP